MRFVWMIIGGVLLFSACGSSPDTSSSAADGTVAASTGSETRPEILKLALPTADGGTFDPDSVAGKPVLLWFWGSH